MPERSDGPHTPVSTSPPAQINGGERPPRMNLLRVGVPQEKRVITFTNREPAERSVFNRVFYRNRRRHGWAIGSVNCFAGRRGLDCRRTIGCCSSFETAYPV